MGRGDGTLKYVMVERKNLRNSREAFFGIVAAADVPVFVRNVVFDHKPGLRIEIDAALGHQPEVVIGSQRAMLDLRAARQSRGPDPGSIRVDQRPQSLFLRFVASRVELLLRKRHFAAF